MPVAPVVAPVVAVPKPVVPTTVVAVVVPVVVAGGCGAVRRAGKSSGAPFGGLGGKPSVGAGLVARAAGLWC